MRWAKVLPAIRLKVSRRPAFLTAEPGATLWLLE
jgi:hypothetical protein